MTSLLELWWVFPAAVLFSTIAIGAGISGALFFSPFFMLVVGLSPAQAVGAGLFTEIFGMGNGLRAYLRARLVDLKAARRFLLGAVPAVAIGALLAHRLPEDTLRIVFGCGLLILSYFLVFVRKPPPPEDPGEPAAAPAAAEGTWVPAGGEEERRSASARETVLVTREGIVYVYPVCRPVLGTLLAAAGGLVTGVISAGLPEITTTHLVVQCRVPPRVAVATSVFTLAITAFVGASIHALAAAPAWHVVGWSVPGVLVGSTVGSRIGHYLPPAAMEKALGVVFGLVGALVLALQLVS